MKIPSIILKIYFGDEYNDIPVIYIRQEWNKETRDRPWGTTGAVCSLTRKVNKPFILVNSDDIYGKETFQRGYDLLNRTKNNIIGGCLLEKTMPTDDETEVNRGVIEVNHENNMVLGIKEMLKISAKKILNF